MKKITLIIATLFIFQGIAQAQVNWLSIDEFEKSVKKNNKDFFIVIDDNRNYSHYPKEKIEKRNNQLFSFLENDDFIEYINDNFICFRFNPLTESFSFNGVEYKRQENKRQNSHEFINFLTSSEKNNLPAVVLRTNNFELFKYSPSIPNTNELTVLLAAEKLKHNYLVDNLEENSPSLQRSARMVDVSMKKLEDSKKDIIKTSVFDLSRFRRDDSFKIVNYFQQRLNETQDLDSFIKK